MELKLSSFPNLQKAVELFAKRSKRGLEPDWTEINILPHTAYDPQVWRLAESSASQLDGKVLSAFIDCNGSPLGDEDALETLVADPESVYSKLLIESTRFYELIEVLEELCDGSVGVFIYAL